MSARQQCIQILTEAAPYIRDKYGVRTMSLFGSMARGDFNDNSDADIYVEMDPVFRNVLSLKEYLQQLLGRMVDLVRKHSTLDAFIINEIEKDGIKIF